MTPIDRAIFLASARSYVGTPFHHHGRVKGAGIDCIGLLICAARDAGIAIVDDLSYKRIPQGDFLREKVAEQAEEIPLACAAPGDFFLARVRPRHPAKHVLIVTGPTLIHVDPALKGVVEVRFTTYWADRVAHAFRLPGLSEPGDPVAWPTAQDEIPEGFDVQTERLALVSGGCCGQASGGAL